MKIKRGNGSAELANGISLYDTTRRDDVMAVHTAVDVDGTNDLLF